MILHFTSTVNSFLWCHSGRLAFFQCVLPITGIMSHYVESMLSLWEDRCAHYVWSGALITVIVRESWGWLSSGVCMEAAGSVCMRIHTGEYSVTKTLTVHEYEVSAEDTWYSARAAATLHPECGVCDLMVGTVEGLWRHCCSWRQWCVETLLLRLSQWENFHTGPHRKQPQGR